MPLPTPFIVLATANPLESQGVFPLPEAHLDRFLVQLKMGYLSETVERAMIQRIRLDVQTEVKSMLDPGDLTVARLLARQVEVAEDVLAYIVRLGRLTREDDRILVGASPRALISLAAFSQALALLDGRVFVLPDDVKEALYPVLNHRLIYRQDFRLDSDTSDQQALFADIMGRAPVPVERVEA